MTAKRNSFVVNCRKVKLKDYFETADYSTSLGRILEKTYEFVLNGTNYFRWSHGSASSFEIKSNPN